MGDQQDVSNFSWKDMFRGLWYLLGDQKKKYLILSIIVFLVQFYELIPPYIVGRIVDFFSTYRSGQSLREFYQYVGFLGIVTGIISLIRLSSKQALSNIQAKTVYTTRVRGFEKLLDFSIKWHDKENTGNKVQKIQNGTGVFRDLQRALSNDVYYNTAIITGVLIFFAFQNFPLFILAACYLVCFVLVQVKFYKITHQLNNEYNRLVEQASGTYYEGLSNVLTIKTLGVQKDFQKSINDKETLTRNHSFSMIKIGNNKWKVFQVVNAIFLAVSLLVVGQSYLANIISIGSIFIFFNYFAKLQGSIGFSTELLENMISYKISIARMMPIYWEKPSHLQGTKEFPQHWKKISIHAGLFDYKDVGLKDSALYKINLTINKYEKIGIVGRSGSGKSTLAKVLLGLYQLKSGEYRLGNTNYYDISHEAVTQNISLVLQDSEMFNMTLRDNITLMREFDQKLFTDAIAISQLEELITHLPDGLDTLIGEKGYRLSGGERQRIGIARAIYKDPQILVLDEATSSLDTKTERIILEAMDKKLTKKTLIMIAHRVSTLKNVDKVYVFDGGKIVEEGSFAELSQDLKSKFYELSRTTTPIYGSSR